MVKKIIIISAAGLGAILLVLSTLFFLRSNDLDSQLRQAKAIVQKMQEEFLRIQSEKDKLAKENDKLQADTVSYVAINTKLQDEKQGLQKSLEEGQKIIEAKESVLQRSKERMQEIEKKLEEEKTSKKEEFLKEKKFLEEKIASLNTTLNKERGLYRYNLGVAYTQAKMYDEAVEAYEKSIESDPNNAEAHYNIAIIYDKINQDPEKAAAHYKKYLRLNPDAEEREEIEAIIGKSK